MIRQLEIATNVAILIVCAAIATVLVKDRIIGGRQGPPGLEQITPGSLVNVPGVDWKASERNVVLVLSTGCHFCSESADFYKRLATASVAARFRLIAVFPQSIEEGAAYVKRLSIDVPEIRHNPLSAMNVRATPTVLLVDSSGTVRRVWTGKLKPEAEVEVVSAASGV